MNNWVSPQIRDRAAVLCMGLVSASVLVFLPGGLFRFAWAKIVILLLATAAGLFAGPGGRVPRQVGIILGVGAVLLFVAALGSAEPGAALLGRWPRYEGALVLGLYAAMPALGAKVLSGPEQARRWPVLLRALAVASLVLALVSSLESAGLRPLGGAADLRPGATLGNASDQGLAGLIISAVLALPSLHERRSPWLLRAGCLAGVLTTVLSGSRAALLGLTVAILATLLAILFTERRLDRQTVTAAIGALVGLGILVLLLPAARDRLLAGATVAGRWQLWGHSLDIVKDHPWSGVGPSGFVDAFPSYQNQQWAIEVGGDFPPDSPHMWLLQAALAGGIPLLLLTLLMALAILRLAAQKIRAAEKTSTPTLIGAFAAVAGYTAGLLTGFTSPGTTPLALFLCGALIATTATPPPALPGKRGAATSKRPTGKLPAFLAAGMILTALVIAVPAMAAEWPMDAGARSVKNGDLASAEKQFQNAYALRPWDSDTALLAAQSFAGPAADGNREAAQRAVQWATTSLHRTPESIEAGLALSIGYIYSDNLPAAKQHLDELIIRAPYTTELYIQRGVANFGLGHPEQCLTDLNTAASQTPTSPMPWQIMGTIYDRLGQHENAAAARLTADKLSHPRTQ